MTENRTTTYVESSPGKYSDRSEKVWVQDFSNFPTSNRLIPIKIYPYVHMKNIRTYIQETFLILVKSGLTPLKKLFVGHIK